MDFYKKRSARHRKVLDISLAEMYTRQKAQTREIFSVLKQQGYGVLGYRGQLQIALDQTDRALAAIAALEKVA